MGEDELLLLEDNGRSSGLGITNGGIILPHAAAAFIATAIAEDDICMAVDEGEEHDFGWLANSTYSSPSANLPLEVVGFAKLIEKINCYGYFVKYNQLTMQH